MVQSRAQTVDAYLAELPPERRQVVQAVRNLVLQNLAPGLEEGMQYGMIGYYVPHSLFPAGYHCDPRQPLPYAALAAQKNYYSLYLMTVYGDGQHWQWFQDAWAKTGKKLDMGKCCIRFKQLEDLATEVIAQAFKNTSVAAYIQKYQSGLAAQRQSKGPKPAGKNPASKGPTAKSPPAKKPAAPKTAPAKAAPKKSAANKNAQTQKNARAKKLVTKKAAAKRPTAKKASAAKSMNKQPAKRK